MNGLERAKVSLLIDEDDLIPSEITALLGAEPWLGVRKGETFIGSHGKPIKAKTGKWAFGSDWESPPHLDRQIADLFGALSNDKAVWAYLTNRFHCYVAVGAYFHDWTGGMTLHPTTLMSLAERNLSIDFDLYAPAASTDADGGFQ